MAKYFRSQTALIKPTSIFASAALALFLWPRDLHAQEVNFAALKNENFFVYQCAHADDPRNKDIFFIMLSRGVAVSQQVVDNKDMSASRDIYFEKGHWRFGGEQAIGSADELHKEIYRLPFKLVTAAQFEALYHTQPEETCSDKPPPPAPPGPEAKMTETPVPPEILAQADRLMRAVKDRDVPEIARMAAATDRAGNGNRGDDKYLRSFFLDGDMQRIWDKRRKSILDILRAGKIHAKAFVWPEEKAEAGAEASKPRFVFFIPEPYLKEAEANPRFYVDEYLVKYFACWIEKDATGWHFAALCDDPIQHTPRDPNNAFRYEFPAPP